MSEAKRAPVNYLYTALNLDFIRAMAEIASYADSKYGEATQYKRAVLTGDKSPMNHVFEHAREYLLGIPHDHFKTREHQLAAIAYNAMMEYYYLKSGFGELSPLCLSEQENLNTLERKE